MFIVNPTSHVSRLGAVRLPDIKQTAGGDSKSWQICHASMIFVFRRSSISLFSTKEKLLHKLLIKLESSDCITLLKINLWGCYLSGQDGGIGMAQLDSTCVGSSKKVLCSLAGNSRNTIPALSPKLSQIVCPKLEFWILYATPKCLLFGSERIQAILVLVKPEKSKSSCCSWLRSLPSTTNPPTVSVICLNREYSGSGRTAPLCGFQLLITSKHMRFIPRAIWVSRAWYE